MPMPYDPENDEAYDDLLALDPNDPDNYDEDDEWNDEGDDISDDDGVETDEDDDFVYDEDDDGYPPVAEEDEEEDL